MKPSIFFFKPSKLRVVQNLYQDKASMQMTHKEFKLSVFSFWIERNQPLTIDMTKEKCSGDYPLALNSILIPDSCPFQYSINEYLV